MWSLGLAPLHASPCCTHLCYPTRPLRCVSAVTLARLPDTRPALYRNKKMYPLTHEEPGMLLLRIDAPVFFANCVVSLHGFQVLFDQTWFTRRAACAVAS